MKSIRRTLLLTVLCVLIITLGVVSVVVYRLSVSSLREKEQAAKDLVEQRYNDLQDEELRARADLLARDVQQNFQSEKWWLRWVLAAVGGYAPLPPGPFGQVPVLTTLATWLRSPISWEINTRYATVVTLMEDETYHNTDYEFVQMTADWGASWRSRSLGDYQLPFDTSRFRRDVDAKPVWDFVDLPDGTKVRRVVVKAPVTRWTESGAPLWRPRKDDSPHPSRAITGVASVARSPSPRGPARPAIMGPPPAGMQGSSLPNFYLQCAWDVSPNNPMLRDKIAERDRQLAEIESETDRSISNLRTTLAWTVVGAIGVTLLGGWLLVGLGLFPLKRLSYAVSEISAKDFRLPIDPKSLPAEVNPVAEKLSQALAQLQAAFEREKRAAADISHELRTPLAALTTTIEVACRKPRTAEQYKQTLDECRAIAGQMGLLVERMLVLAWIDAGADVVRPEHVEVGDLVGGVAAIAKPLAEVQGLTFKVNVPKPITVRTDPDKLREVVMNLTHNAIEYNRPGGEVELSATPRAQGGVVLEVRDTGVGMPAEIHDKIFERFFRGDPSRNAAGVHAGLGLAIVKEYVDRLGGRLTVDSAVGRGSRFRIELPNAL